MKWEGNGKFMQESFLLSVNIAVQTQTTSKSVHDT